VKLVDQNDVPEVLLNIPPSLVPTHRQRHYQGDEANCWNRPCTDKSSLQDYKRGYEDILELFFLVPVREVDAFLARALVLLFGPALDFEARLFAVSGKTITG